MKRARSTSTSGSSPAIRRPSSPAWWPTGSRAPRGAAVAQPVRTSVRRRRERPPRRPHLRQPPRLPRRPASSVAGRMSFFERNRKELEKRGIDPSRLPPGQYHTDRFPVLHEGSVPEYGDLTQAGAGQWDLVLGGLV